MNKEKVPYCCAECLHADFINGKEPLCKVDLRELEHNTAKQVAVWCPLKMKVQFLN